MRRLVAAITCLAFTGSVAFAQQEQPAPPPPEPPQQQQPTYVYPPPQQSTYEYPPQQPNPAQTLPSPEQMYRSGRRQQAVGMLLTFVGIGIGVLGLALLYDVEHNPDRTFGDGLVEGLWGTMFSIMGVGSFIPGVALWVHGDFKMSDALQMGASGTTLAPAPRVAAAPGLSLQWRF
jgi:hypothetical protein